MSYEYHMPPQQGWQCPVCGRILSPWAYECPCGGQGRRTYTSNKSTITLNELITDHTTPEDKEK